MTKYETSNSYENEETELDKQYKSVIAMYDKNRASVKDFESPRRNQDELYSDIHYVEMKKNSFAQRNGEFSSLDDDKALEAVLFYMGNNDQLFARESFSEPGSDYDDYANGVDVVFGLTRDKKGEYDTCFSVDACTAMSRKAVTDKFINSEHYAVNDAPGCSIIKYYQHEGKQTNLGRKPSYIVGASPAAISKAVERFEVHEEYSIAYEADENLRKKILIEILVQAQSGFRACQLVKKPSDRTKRTFEAHQKIHSACVDTLYKLYRIDKNDKDASKKFDAAIKDSVEEYEKTDDVFNSIFREANYRRNQISNRLKGLKAKRASQAQQRINATPNTNPA